MRRASPGSPRSSCSRQPLGGTAQDVVDLARTSLDQCDGVGIQVLEDDRVGVRATTDRPQLRSRHPPGRARRRPVRRVRCATASAMTSSPSRPTSDGRGLRPPARRAGLIACWPCPLVAHDELIGVLNLYAWPAVGFAGWDRRQCGIFAHRASNLLASARVYARTQVLIAKLEGRLAAIPGTQLGN